MGRIHVCSLTHLVYASHRLLGETLPVQFPSLLVQRLPKQIWKK